MFDYWYNLPPELQQHVCEMMDMESKFLFASSSMSHFNYVVNCLDSLYSIIVTPLPRSDSSAPPMYNIRLGTQHGIGCSLDITRRCEKQTIVEYTLWNNQHKGGWKHTIDEAYEKVATNFLKKFIRKSESTLRKFEILPMANSPRQKELLYDNFNIKKCKNLQFIQLNSGEIGRDFVRTGFVTLKQIQSATEEVVLTNTAVPIEHVFGKYFIELDQKNLTSSDVLKYLEFLKISRCHTTRILMINLIEDENDPNYINLEIKQQLRRIFVDTHSVFENNSEENSFSINASNENNSIIIHFDIGIRLYISQECHDLSEHIF